MLCVRENDPIPLCVPSRPCVRSIEAFLMRSCWLEFGGFGFCCLLVVGVFDMVLLVDVLFQHVSVLFGVTAFCFVM